MSALRHALSEAVGVDAVVSNPAEIRPYLSDATEAQGLRGTAEAVVLPADAEQAAAVLRICSEAEAPVVPRGGGTGYAAGCVAEGGIVVSTERMNRVRSIDPLLWRAEVDAGVTTRRLQRLARENGLYFPVDPGAAEQSHVGGNVATNAGGPHAFKYGVTGAWVTGLEVVLATGELTRFGRGLRKDVAGYDLRSLLIGSEGTLGLITAVQLKLIPAVEARFPVVGLYVDADRGAEALTAAMACGIVPAALEYLDEPCMRVAGAAFPGPKPRGGAFTLIAEADGSEAEARAGRAQLIEALEADALELHAPDQGSEIEALWRWREGVGIAADAARGGKVSEDIAVPLDRLAEAVRGTVEIGRRLGLEACSWGHAGDGNLHSTFLFDRSDPGAVKLAEKAASELFELAIELGGSVSGEHGIGRVKAGQLSRQWDRPAVELHRGVKRLIDPKGVLNPGKKEP